ncbi:hypothetical protein [Microbispora rosea]|uniref:hypothetical protein n=1 Tax=Microbispora rosea TaxID=58117 RepID=UPI003D9337B3
MAPSDEPEEIVVRLTDDQAIVIGALSETKRSLWGRRISDLTHFELASLLRTLDPATRAFIETHRLTGRLVELDPISRAMWSTCKKVTEEGGWIQTTLRSNQGQFARGMRIRPITGVAAMSGGVAILGAIAAQAQTAEMARDIKVIRQRVDEIYEYLESGQISAVENAVEQVEDLVEWLRFHGKDGIEESAFSVIRDRLGEARHKCMRHLKDAVRKLEDAKQHGSPRKAERSLSKGVAEEVMLYLDLLGKLYAASIQFGLAQVAFEYHKGKLDVARTRAEHITKSNAKFRAEIEDVCGRLGQIDESVRARFGSVKRRVWLPPVSGVVMVAEKKVITLRLAGASVPISMSIVAGVGGALLAHIVQDVDAATQARAEKILEERLLRLTGASSRAVELIAQEAGSLEGLRTLTEELAGSGE